MQVSLSDPDISWDKGGDNMFDNLRVIVQRIVAGVISRLIYDWLKSFFKDND